MQVVNSFKDIAIFTNEKWIGWLRENFELQDFNSVILSGSNPGLKIERCTFQSLEKYHFKAKFGISLHFQRIFSMPQIRSFDLLLNVHPGLVPQSRGTYPLFWNVLNYEPVGVSVHEITQKIDIGRCLYRVEIPYELEDSMRIISPRVEDLEKRLFKDSVNNLLQNRFPLFSPEAEVIGRNHKLQDFLDLRDRGVANLNDFQISRLKLAFDHPNYALPAWLV
jgi:methionyl-tRNA formyltransferase